MSITKSREKTAEEKEKITKWDEAIRDAKDRIQHLRKSIFIFKERKKAGEPWPEATQN